MNVNLNKLINVQTLYKFGKNDNLTDEVRSLKSEEGSLIIR